ncbi:15012_t:CDS:2 [Entrophospora sp. SA101]|nr:15012_t:CDS:2 [Entrophospora sp. SA101]
MQFFIRQEKFESWREVNDELNGDLKTLEVLGFLQVVNTNSSESVPTQNKPNTFR